VTTIAADLEHVRQTRRADRIERVLVALRERRRERTPGVAVPRALNHSISEFTRELTEVQERLRTPDSRRDAARSPSNTAT